MDEIRLTGWSCEYPVYKSYVYILYIYIYYTIMNLCGVLGIPAGSPDLLQTAQKAHQVVSTLSIFSRPNFCGCSESTSIRFLKINFTCSSTKLAETVARFQWSKSNISYYENSDDFNVPNDPNDPRIRLYTPLHPSWHHPACQSCHREHEHTSLFHVDPVSISTSEMPECHCASPS